MSSFSWRESALLFPSHLGLSDLGKQFEDATNEACNDLLERLPLLGGFREATPAFALFSRRGIVEAQYGIEDARYVANAKEEKTVEHLWALNVHADLLQFDQ